MRLLEISVILGVVTGLLYALSGAGLVLLHRTSGYVSFVQGDIAAVGLFVGFWLNTHHTPYGITALAVVLVCAVVGGLAGCLIIPMEKLGLLSAALATIALGITIEGAENVTVGGEVRSFPSVGNATLVQVGEVGLTRSNVVSTAVCIGLFVLLGLGFKKLNTGLAMRAVSESGLAAQILGVRSRRLKILSWTLAGGLAGVSGLFIAPTFSLTPTSVNTILVFGFAALVLGGIDSVLGALVGGLSIGILSNLTAAYVSPNLVTASIYVALVAILIFRPHGLFGIRPMERV